MVIPKSVAKFNAQVTNHVTRRFAGRLPGFAIVTHVGRRSGRTYQTPVNMFRDGERYVFALTYGANSQWVENVTAAGECEVRTQGNTVRLHEPRIFTDPDRRLVPAPVRLALGAVNVSDFLSMRPVASDDRPPLVVVMGVEGVGKTTVGRRLADELGVEFVDGDDEHSPEAKARMAAGIPLDDAARAPWLDRLNAYLRRHESSGLVLACSALTRAYRRRLTRGVANAVFVALVAPREILEERVANRRGHFAGTSLLDSQLETIELGDDVRTVDATAPVDEIVAAAARVVA
ncbi:MAG TPA: gluconokinase, GntK/IdnK-type [Ilumatobacter sp.]|jgi:gluconokinase|nr:gluconokinase, GntK/IdnK-type [Ilumatobacter sp.]